MPGFVGIAFRAKPDASQYELFYLRPRNSLAEDQAMRNHSVQYSAAPDFGWYRLRREWPFTYESYAELAPETWTKVKIDVKGRVAKLYLNGSSRPSLVVDGLKSENLRGGIALWGYEGEEAYFANLRVTPAAPEAVKNGSDAAGKWEVRCNTDAQPMEGILTLAREGAKLTGTWSGTLGGSSSIKLHDPLGTTVNSVSYDTEGDWSERRLGPRENLEAKLGQHPILAQAANHQLGQIEAGGVLDHLAAAAHQRAGAIDETHAQNEIAHAAKAIAA